MSVRSLGQLTLDLVAKTGGFTGPMDRASRRTKKQMSDMGKQVEAAANKIAMLSVAAASAAATGIAAMTRAGLENVDQQAKLARQLDSTIGGLRGLQLAANDAGVETGVINSAMERFSARLGEAMRGTGQAREALDRLGLSAAELAGTDVDERVALIADRVQELGLSGAETSDLLRQFGIRNREITNLLRQGGGAIRDARQEVEDYGLAISAVDAAAIEAANDAMSRAGLLTESIRNSLAVELAPIILEIASRFNEAAREAGGLGQVVHDSVRTSIEIVARLADAFAEVNRTIHVAGVGTREFGLTVVRGMYDASRAIMEGPVNALNHMIEAMNRLPGIDIGFIDQPEMVYQAREQIEELERSIRAARQEIEDTLAADPPSVAIFEFLDDVDRRIEEMRKNIGDGPGLGKILFDDDDEEAVKKAQQEAEQFAGAFRSLHDQLRPIEAAQRRYREELDLLNAAHGRAKELLDAKLITEEEYNSILRDRSFLLQELESRYRDSTMTPSSAYGGIGFGSQIGDPVGGMGAGQDNETSYWERWLESAELALTDFDQLAANTAENFQRGFGNAFESMVFDSQSLGDAMYNLTEGIARSMVSALGEMAAQWLAYQAVQMMVGRTTQSSAASTMITNAMAQQQMAGLNAFSSTAAIPIVGPFMAPGAMAAAIAATSPSVSAISSLAVAGMAHDGIDSIPREGTWLLDKGERVLNAPQASKLDRFLDQQQAQDRRRDGGGVTVNIIENPERAGQRETTVNADGREEESLFVADIYGDGPRSRAIQNAFGLQRRGR